MLEKVNGSTALQMVPTSKKEAGTLHSVIGKMLARIEALKMRYAERIAALSAERDQKVGELTKEALDSAKLEEQFVLAHRQTLFGNRTTFDLPGGSVELKNSPLRLDIEDEEQTIAQLEKLNRSDLINYHPTVSKTRLRDALEEDPTLLKKLKGVSLEQGLVLRMRFAACDTQIKHAVEEVDSMLHLHTPQKRK